MRYVWQATTRDDAIDLPPRTVRRVDVAHFLEVRNGLIVSSHEYGHMENGNVAPPQSAGPDGESGDAAVTADRWVKAYNRASSFGDYISAFADNVDWWRMSTGRFPHGKAGGLADYREALEFDAAALSEQRMDPYLVIAAGPRAAMRYRWFAKAPTGDTVAWDRVAVITVSGERITRLHEYGGPLAAS
jgi:ketosteroid isomerase-like protein